MLRRFGGWQGYRIDAPRRVVEEQIIDWSACLKAEADINKENTPPSP